MRRITKRDTKPELALRRLIHRMGYRYRLYRTDLPGTPDLVFPSRKKVIFLHGCFWHQHKPCTLARMPKSRLSYWGPKLARNVERDHETRNSLSHLGWTSLVIWECEVSHAERITGKVKRFLQ